MKINNALYEKALKIIERQNRKRKYISVCLHAGLCPACGKKTEFDEVDEHAFNLQCRKCKFEFEDAVYDD